MTEGFEVFPYEPKIYHNYNYENNYDLTDPNVVAPFSLASGSTKVWKSARILSLEQEFFSVAKILSLAQEFYPRSKNLSRELKFYSWRKNFIPGAKILSLEQRCYPWSKNFIPCAGFGKWGGRRGGQMPIVNFAQVSRVTEGAVSLIEIKISHLV